MQLKSRKLIISVFLLILFGACSAGSLFNNETGENEPAEDANIDVNIASMNVIIPSGSDEPILVTGTVPFTSPFFLNSSSEPFVMLEDQAGFIARDHYFEFTLASQTIGPVWQVDEEKMGYTLSLPAQPQGTLVDIDNDANEDSGVMVFAVAYWANIWGGPFLEAREGTGWSGAHASTITDPNQDYEIVGGHLILWSPDNDQGFPSGFGEDGLLFTTDDPIQIVPAGYNIVDLNSEPFEIYKEANPKFELVEGASRVKDFSDMSYEDAFIAMFERVSVEYPFTTEKGIEWDALYSEYLPMVKDARSDTDFYRVLKAFAQEFPDAHVGISFDAQVFWEDAGGSFGLLLTELSDGRVIVTEVLPGTAGARAGIERGAEIIRWNGQPVSDAIGEVNPWLGPFSTAHDLRREQVQFLTRMPVDTVVDITFQNPGGASETIEVTAVDDYDSLFAYLWYFNTDPIALPIEIEMLDSALVGEEQVAYIKITTFSDDYNLMAQIWHYQLSLMVEENINRLIIDMRTNGGGNGGLAMDFVGYFFAHEIELSHRSYYNHISGEFEFSDWTTTIEPADVHFQGQVLVLVSDDCVSACEGFVAAMSNAGNVTIIGHTPTAGAFGEVGRGQYTMPGDYDMQFPTGRPETMDGQLYIENVGVVPDILVPITYESALGEVDAVLQTAIDVLLGR